MLLLLVGLVILAIISSQLVPEYVTVSQRQKETELRGALGQICMAIDWSAAWGRAARCWAS